MKKQSIIHRQNSLIFFFAIVVMFTSCIRDYDPDILAKDETKYVVSGVVANGDSIQTVNVSTSSSINAPKYYPVIGCDVKLIDDQGDVFPLEDGGNGKYSGKVDSAFLQPGSMFKVEVTTSTGDKIESDFDQITAGPALDTVYYERQDLQGNQLSALRMGIQFYTNLNGAASDSKYYRWEAIETWEYHAMYPLEWYYDGSIHHVYPPDYSNNVCWITKRVPDIFLLSTENLSENRYERYPLHFVDNRTSRLAYGYSLLVKQYSLSNVAYEYFEQVRINTNPTGGLYDKQPLVVKGNLHNLNHPENVVLGYFSASSVSSKRIFVKDVEDLTLDFFNDCSTLELRAGLKQIPRDQYPGYLEGDQMGYKNYLLDKTCVNCTLSGGTKTKPAFWPL